MQCRSRSTGQSTVEEYSSSPCQLWNSEDTHLSPDQCTWSTAACRQSFFYYRQHPKHAWHTHTHTHTHAHTDTHTHTHIDTNADLTKANPNQWAQLVLRVTFFLCCVLSWASGSANYVFHCRRGGMISTEDDFRIFKAQEKNHNTNSK